MSGRGISDRGQSEKEAGTASVMGWGPQKDGALALGSVGL